MARQTIPISGIWSAIAGLINTNFTEAYDFTGWAEYRDTAYTDVSPFSVVASTDTVLPNNAGAKIESQKPTDITEFYDGTVITGRNGDALGITIDLKAVPTTAGATFVEIWIDIGGSIGPLYKRIITFPKGSGVVRPINFTVNAYTLGTWEANGGTVYVRSDGPVDIYDIRYVFTRLHKAQ